MHCVLCYMSYGLGLVSCVLCAVFCWALWCVCVLLDCLACVVCCVLFVCFWVGSCVCAGCGVRYVVVSSALCLVMLA